MIALLIFYSTNSRGKLIPIFSNSEKREIGKTIEKVSPDPIVSDGIIKEKKIDRQMNIIENTINEIQLIEWPTIQTALEESFQVMAIIITALLLLFGINLLIDRRRQREPRKEFSFLVNSPSIPGIGLTGDRVDALGNLPAAAPHETRGGPVTQSCTHLRANVALYYGAQVRTILRLEIHISALDCLPPAD
jgi:preprotein translocase SecE subunit